MKLAASNIAWAADNDELVYARLKQLGFSAIEIAPTRWVEDKPYSEHGITSAKAQAITLKAAHALSVCSMQSLWFGITEQLFGSEQEREFLYDYTCGAINFAAAVGCAHLVFGSPKNRVTTTEQDIATGQVFFKRCADYAESKGVIIGMEANPERYGTNYVNRTSEAADLVNAVNSKHFRLNFDLGTVLINEESIDNLGDSLALASHVHVSEPGLDPIIEREQHQCLAAALRAINYQGYVSLEMRNSGLEALFDSLDILARVFRQ